MPIARNPGEAHFLNVDLDIRSRSDLERLASAMGDKVHVHYLGRDRGLYKAYFELHSYKQTADASIRGFCALIRKLPKTERKLWDGATIREFNIGIRAGMKPITFEITIASETVTEASELNARIGFTIYSPAMETLNQGSLLSSTKERSC
jgi:hypothetical protein